MSYLDDAAAARGDGLRSARRLPVRPAVPVLLDGRSPRSSRTTSSTTSRPTTPSGSATRPSRTSSKLLFQTDYPQWLRQHHDWSSVVPTFASIFASVLAAYAIDAAALPRRSTQSGLLDLPRLPGAAVASCSSRSRRSCSRLGLFDTTLGADPHLSDLPDPVLHLAADGLFPHHSLRARGMRADRRRDALADPAARSCCRWRCRA